MPIKISKVANDLNVGIPTLVEFLQKHNQEVGDPGNLNLRISDEQHEMLVRAAKSEKIGRKAIDATAGMGEGQSEKQGIARA